MKRALSGRIRRPSNASFSDRSGSRALLRSWCTSRRAIAGAVQLSALDLALGSPDRVRIVRWSGDKLGGSTCLLANIGEANMGEANIGEANEWVDG